VTGPNYAAFFTNSHEEIKIDILMKREKSLVEMIEYSGRFRCTY